MVYSVRASQQPSLHSRSHALYFCAASAAYHGTTWPFIPSSKVSDHGRPALPYEERWSAQSGESGNHHFGKEVVGDGHPAHSIALQVGHLLLQGPAEYHHAPQLRIIRLTLARGLGQVSDGA